MTWKEIRNAIKTCTWSHISYRFEMYLSGFKYREIAGKNRREFGNYKEPYFSLPEKTETATIWPE